MNLTGSVFQHGKKSIVYIKSPVSNNQDEIRGQDSKRSNGEHHIIQLVGKLYTYGKGCDTTIFVKFVK